MPTFHRIALCTLWGAAIAFAPAAQAPTVATDEALLRRHGIGTDDASLLRFFRERTLPPVQVNILRATLGRLNSPKFSVRSQAARELVQAGLNAKAMLLELGQDPKTDPETARRAELCLREIGAGHEVEIAQSAARLLKARKPPTTAAVLLDYVPFAGDPQILPAVQDALNATALRGDQADAALVKAARDAHAGKRAAAGVALIRGAGLKQKPIVAHLLEDPSVKVRLPIAMALVQAKDKNAVPALIERIADAPDEQLWQVTELLERVAGETAPAVYVSAKTPPAQVRDAWRAWWKGHAAKVDLAKLTEQPSYLGYTLLTYMGLKAQGGGKVVELRPDRTTHWEIQDLTYPVDARVIGPKRVLIAEYLGRRVTERDHDGKILWEIPINMPIACQRLPGGDTFIATRNQLLVVDADKRTKFSHFHQNGSISAASRARDGHMVYVASTGQGHWLDAQGKEIKTFNVGYIYSLGGNIEILPNRHLLVPLYRDNKIAELDVDGKIVWQITAQHPVSATRLPNGHTLVVGLGNQVQELDRVGNVVWTHRVESRAWRARGR